jgi:oxidoreductase family protein
MNPPDPPVPAIPDPRPLPPREPELEECCNSGCEPCVFDRYYDALERYREALAAWFERHPEVTPSKASGDRPE